MLIPSSGFCVTRVIASCLRMGWAYHHNNVHLAMTAQIFVYAGVIILIVSNLWWSQRILRAQHPYFGWSFIPSHTIAVVSVISALTIVAYVTSVCVQFYHQGTLAQSVARGLQQYGETLFAVLALLPIPILFISFVAKTHPDLKERQVDNFGKRSIETKILVCFATAMLLSTGAVFRASVSFAPLLALSEPTPWFLSKACFYIFNFTLEAIVVIFWATIRTDKLFIVPNGSHGPYSYGNATIFAGEKGNEKRSYFRNDTKAPGFTPTYDEYAGFSRWSSATTIPPIARPNSWGSAKQYMVEDPTDFTAPATETRPSWDAQSGTATRVGTPSAWGASTIRTTHEKKPSSNTKSRSQKVYSPTLYSDARTHQIGTATYTAPSETTFNPSVEFPQPPAAVCIRCLNCGGSNNRAPSPQVYQTQMSMGFDPQSGRWVKRPISVPYSASQYSVHETVCSPDPNKGGYWARPIFGRPTGSAKHNTTTQYSVRETLRPASSTGCCSPDLRGPSSNDRSRFQNFSSPDLKQTHASTFIPIGVGPTRFSRRPSLLQPQQQQQQQQQNSCGVVRTPSNIEFRTRESLEQFRQFNFRNSPELDGR